MIENNIDVHMQTEKVGYPYCTFIVVVYLLISKSQKIQIQALENAVLVSLRYLFRQKNKLAVESVH